MGTTTTFHSQAVDDVEVFYRQAGAANAPAVVLLHGFPTSSHMFRNLIPQLAEKFRVVAPDFPGFGYTVAPQRGQYEYSFERLSDTITAFTEAIGLTRFAMYVFDYGAPIGFRMATVHPERISAIVTQNGNAYEEGLTEAWAPIRAYWKTPSADNRAALRQLLTPETTRWQYTHGVPDSLRDRISPDALAHDQAILDRDAEIQLDLFGSYQTNVARYPQWQAYLRKYLPPVLAIWGKNDPFFAPAGAEAFKRDVPSAEVELLDAGHFALETHGESVGQRMVRFLSEHPR